MFGNSSFGEYAFGEVSAPTSSTAGSALPAGVQAQTAVSTATASGAAQSTAGGVTSNAFVGSATAVGGGGAVAQPAGVSATASVGSTTPGGYANVLVKGIAAFAGVGNAGAGAGSGATAAPAGVNAQGAVGQANGQGAAAAVAPGVGAISSVGAASVGGGSGAVVSPQGVIAQASIGQAAASGSIVIGATAYPGGIKASADAGIAAASGGKLYARAPIGSGYTSHRTHGSEVIPRLRQLSAPVGLAVSLDEAKDTLRIERDDTSLDGLITRWLRGVTAEAEHTTRRYFINRPMRATLDGFNGAVRLASPVFAVEDVAFTDGAGVQQVLDPQDYFLDIASQPGYLVPAPGKSWPSTAAINSVNVDFIAGYGLDDTTVPDCVQLYILGRLSEQWEPSTKKFESTSQSVYLTRLLNPIKVYR